MNRLGLGLAVGAGYVLGRTKKMKLAFAVGTMVAGKRMHLSPRALADLVSQQLRDNPQFKEVGDQLREDLRGVGKAATGALVERRIEGLADRLHGRTAQVRDQLAGVAPDLPGRGEDDRDDDGYADEDDYADPRDEYDEEDTDARSAEGEGDEEEPEPPRKRAAKKTATSTAKKAPSKKTAAPAARKTTAKKAAAKKTAGKKSAPAKAPAKKTARKTTRSRATRGGGGDD